MNGTCSVPYEVEAEYSLLSTWGECRSWSLEQLANGEYVLTLLDEETEDDIRKIRVTASSLDVFTLLLELCTGPTYSLEVPEAEIAGIRAERFFPESPVLLSVDLYSSGPDSPPFSVTAGVLSLTADMKPREGPLPGQNVPVSISLGLKSLAEEILDELEEEEEEETEE